MKKENSTKQINSDAKISIVVPVYNTQDYLHNCVDSILSNTYPNYEVILIDEIASGNMRVYKGDRIVEPVELTQLILNR